MDDVFDIRRAHDASRDAPQIAPKTLEDCDYPIHTRHRARPVSPGLAPILDERSSTVDPADGIDLNIPSRQIPMMGCCKKYFATDWRISGPWGSSTPMPQKTSASCGIAGVLRAWRILGAALLLQWSIVALADARERLVEFAIPSQRADQALTAFASQAGVTLVFPYDLAARSTANQLVGTYTVADGLRALLEGTHLMSAVDSGRIRVRVRGAERQDGSGMNRSSIRRGGIWTALLGALANIASGQGRPAEQQDTDATVALEEVTVTARKVEENLMSVPLAITAMTSKDLEAANIKGLADIMLMTPGFHFESQFAGSRNDRSFSSLTFRGLFLSQNQGTSAGGQLFIDGAPVIGAQPPSIIDIERVEVLKGPQSAYFGRSTFVGAINFVTRDPSEEFRTRLSVETSRWDSYDLSASIEGPLVTDKLAARFTARTYERGGYVPNAADPSGTKLGKQSTNSFSTALVWTPIDTLRVKAFLNYFRDNDGPPAQGAIKPSEFTGRIDASGNCVPFSQAPAGTAALGQAANTRASFGYWCGELPDTDELPGLVYSGNYDTSPAAIRDLLFNPNPLWPVFGPTFKDRSGLRRDAVQGDVRLDLELGSGYAFSSLSAFHSDKMMTVVDTNYRSNVFVNPSLFNFTAVQIKQRDWSQELRLTSPQEQRLRWTLGANYLDVFSPGGPVWSVTQAGLRFAGAVTESNIETPAIFGAGYFDLRPDVTLSVEGRYQKDKITQSPKINASGLPVTGAAAQTLSATFDSFSPRISVDWKYAPDSVAYVLFSRGFRPGGFNAFLATSAPATIAALQAVVPTAGLTYDEEQLDNYEAGVKSTWLGGRGRTTFTVYKDTWKNGQINNSIPVSVGGVVTQFPVVINNGTADLQGVEIEGSFQATRRLRLSGTFVINDSEVRSYGIGPGNAAGNCTDCNNVYGNFAGVIGRQLHGTPRTAGSLTADYSAPIGGRISWYTRADLLYQGKRYIDFAGATFIGASNRLNARVGLRGDSWTVEGFATNLTDDRTMPSAYLGLEGFGSLSAPPTARNEIRFAPAIPRSFGVRATLEF